MRIFARLKLQNLKTDVKNLNMGIKKTQNPPQTKDGGFCVLYNNCEAIPKCLYICTVLT